MQFSKTRGRVWLVECSFLGSKTVNRGHESA